MVHVDSTQSIQQAFLAYLMKQGLPVAIYLKNGVKLKGLIRSYDEFSLLLDEPIPQVIYKTAISTIAPLGSLFSEAG